MHKSLDTMGRSFRKLLWRYNFTIFLAVAAGSITIGIYSLLGIINGTSTSKEATTAAATTFDQATINRVKALTSSSQSDSFVLPTDQRTDPFLEN